MTIVSADGNTVATPIVLTDRPLQLWPALRMDVVIDFAAYPAGTSLYLREAAAQNVGVAVPDPAPGLPIGNVVMRFDVVNKESWFPNDTPPIPSVLTQMPDPIVPEASFQWDFTLVSGQFLVNGLPFDHNRVDHVVLKGSATADELMSYVAERVAPYKKVRRLEFIDAIPKAASGKILRRLLKDRHVYSKSG